MNPIYIDLLRWLCYGVMAVCAAGCIFVLTLIPFMVLVAGAGVASGKKD